MSNPHFEYKFGHRVRILNDQFTPSGANTGVIVGVATVDMAVIGPTWLVRNPEFVTEFYPYDTIAVFGNFLELADVVTE